MDSEPRGTVTKQAPSPPAATLSPEEAYLRKADRALSAMANWGLGLKEQLALLGLEKVTAEAPAGAVALSVRNATQAMLDRSEQVALIGRKLEGLFPKDPELANRWMTQPNRAFAGRRPVDVAIEKGLEGLKSIKTYLAKAV